jgi:hypothetical protein
VGFTAPAAFAVTALLSEAALVASDTTVAVLSVSVAVGWLLQLLRNRPPARAGAASHAKAAGREMKRFMKEER